MRNLELLKQRLEFQGGNSEGRIIREKLKSLEQALKYSYQSELILKDKVEYRALINNNKLKMDYDDKIISIPYNAQMKVGDLFDWPRTNTKWIVYLQIYSEDAYFRGYIRKADTTVNWKDEFGKKHSIYAAVRGPVETKVRSQMKGGLSFDEPNYTLNVLIPNTEDTIKLQRYSKVTIDGKVWEVVATDSLSEAGVIDMGLIESYFNREEDTKEVVQGQIETKIDVDSCLDGLKEVRLGQPINLWTEVTVDGKYSQELVDDAKYIALTGFSYIKDGKLYITKDTTSVRVALEIPKANFRKEFELVGVTEVREEVNDIDIVGDEIVKSYGSTVYRIVKHVNGEEVIPHGIWFVNRESKLYSVKAETDNTIELLWTTGMTGTIDIGFQENGSQEGIKKTIKIESLI